MTDVPAPAQVAASTMEGMTSCSESSHARGPSPTVPSSEFSNPLGPGM